MIISFDTFPKHSNIQLMLVFNESISKNKHSNILLMVMINSKRSQNIEIYSTIGDIVSSW